MSTPYDERRTSRTEQATPRTHLHGSKILSRRASCPCKPSVELGDGGFYLRCFSVDATLDKRGKLPIRQLDRRAILRAPPANRSRWREARRVGSMEQPIQRKARRLQLRIGVAEEGLKAMACDPQPRRGGT